ncbi:MAG: TIGR00730 family Rossman fold protein [Paludibacter sp.]|nr:TIGR00730 family Rossman fold protein [Bacteroidales bacterium]MCM1068658.1 TIGR00730 family Rossman fold protein [Prevotella sp.]MCM1353322.1 TIGR00730 family Rossman fold protein [Bacteroides sp.]MCM1442270.1 TIGR00730 family Rossman fold protein [Muribaculum sp.]MCM1481089.1 TIGR00730 family Rossman fold protein [Paludibacter sp.]
MTICVYCSAKDSIPAEYKKMGTELGTWIAQNGYTLLFGGATGGLMTAVSEAASIAGGAVVGVVPERIVQSGRLSDVCTELVRVENMSVRKQTMRERADVFVCLPGSYGTLDEMFDVIASGTVGEHRKPLYVLNQNGFYEDLRRLASRMKALTFIPAEESYAPRWVNTLEELFEQLKQLS